MIRTEVWFSFGGLFKSHGDVQCDKQLFTMLNSPIGSLCVVNRHDWKIEDETAE